jgi:predicted nucleic acid-binding Zn ribbon protein
VEPPADEPDVAVREVVNDIFKSIDVRRQPALLEQIREAWRELAGPGAATHARPGYLDRQTLVIFVDSAVWLDELARYERAGILTRLQQRFGAEAIKALRLQADPEDRRKPGVSAQ